MFLSSLYRGHCKTQKKNALITVEYNIMQYSQILYCKSGCRENVFFFKEGTYKQKASLARMSWYKEENDSNVSPH